MFIAITAFNKQNLINQLELIYDDNHTYFIHWNKRNIFPNFIGYLKFKKEIKNKYKNVKMVSKYRVYWGHFSIIKSILFAQKYFFKSNEGIFLHIDNKTINLLNINEINNWISQKIRLNFNFFDFNRIALKKINFNPPEQITSNSEKYYDFFTKRNWYKKTSKKNSKFWIFYKYLIKISQIIFDVYFWQKFLKTFSLKTSLRLFNKKYFSNQEIMHVEGLMYKRNWKKLDIINNFNEQFEFKTHCINGCFVILSRDEIKKINYNYSKDCRIKKFNRYCKRKYIPDDFYFSSLYFNFINNKIEQSLDILYYYDINSYNDYLFFNKNLRTENTKFVKRVDYTMMSEIGKLINTTKS